MMIFRDIEQNSSNLESVVVVYLDFKHNESYIQASHAKLKILCVRNCFFFFLFDQLVKNFLSR